jgi:hypothetical protein
MGQIFGTGDLILCEDWIKSMIIGEKKYWLTKTDTGGFKNFAFWLEYDNFIENKGEKVVHFAWTCGLVSPVNTGNCTGKFDIF